MENSKGRYKPVERVELREFSDETSKPFIKVVCPGCQQETPSDHIHLEKSLAKCQSCNAVFSIEAEVEQLHKKEELKQELLRPEGLDLFYYKNDLDITVQQHLQGLDAFGIIFMPGIAALTIFIYFLKGMPVFYPIIFTLIALYFIYRVINYSKNKTYLEINDQFLNIKSRPKQFTKDKTYDVRDIDQVYCAPHPSGMGYFHVNMIYNSAEGQKHVNLVSVKTLTKAKYLEQEIERYLDIKNRKVIGEIP